MFSQKTIIIGFITIIGGLIAKSERTIEQQGSEIRKWTDDLGKELWNLGTTITNNDQIQQSYLHRNAKVTKKKPMELLAEVQKDIEWMMDRKMDAVLCIVQEAEKQAEEFDVDEFLMHNATFAYYNSKLSETVQVDESDGMDYDNSTRYLPFTVNNDTHFYNLAINTNHSSVHVPSNIFDGHDNANEAVFWSEALDQVFINNYKSDPALSWQYFGSTTGILRHYPAKKWFVKKADEFDCRIRSWFIEAATCTKDVVILVDTSGSMDGMGKHIAYLTVDSILDTFSNNDYINVLNYSESINYTIPCFEDMLVQATKENIREFKNAVKGLKPTGKTKLDQALEAAFRLLEDVRAQRGCGTDNKTCNQAIMVITDGISKNMSDIAEKWNGYGDTKPVRLFTYLIGEEAVNEKELQWLACNNRGYYSHVQSLEQVTASVLQYINVVARPLVLQSREHPASWTHAYADVTYDDKLDNNINEPYRLLTSVAAPAFDKRANNNTRERRADLLGVAGTDVPISDIEKLTLPYKIGVNAYAFIVSNNGYVLMHPDLRPNLNKYVENYNSIDLAEVEQLDDNKPPRVLGEQLLLLRDSLVNGTVGSILGVPVKYHYDNMKRVTREKYDYYFAPLFNTPFSIAFAFPDGYGDYSLQVGDEIMKVQSTGKPLTGLFNGSNWKVHPKWVYCKYHYMEGHEFDSPEEELLHFLQKMHATDFKWVKQYKPPENRGEDLSKVQCGIKSHGDDDYYCDRELVQRLVFDAQNTYEAFSSAGGDKYNEGFIIKRFNATLRFVATMSGLTRWEYLSKEVENASKKEFGDWHRFAIDETWYKSAVIQRRYDKESFVYSVPFDSGNEEDLYVTGSYAIFPINAGLEAPGSVVGFQFAHKNFKQQVEELTSRVSNQCPDCSNCNDSSLSCYIIDNSGYVIFSQEDSETGVFFGEIEGDLMRSMLAENVFEEVPIYDFQGVCEEPDNDGSGAPVSLLTPFNYFHTIVKWFFVNLAWLAFEVNFTQLWTPVYVYGQDLVNNATSSAEEVEDEKEGDGVEIDEEEEEEVKDEEEPFKFPCELKRTLFILNQTKLSHDNFPIPVPGTKVSRQYYLRKIPYSNLLFIAVDANLPAANNEIFTVDPEMIEYEEEIEYPCQKLNLTYLTRRRLTGCFNEHEDEKEITECGRSSSNGINYAFLSLLMCIKYLL